MSTPIFEITGYIPLRGALQKSRQNARATARLKLMKSDVMVGMTTKSTTVLLLDLLEN
jgi:hypothetical protein